MNKLFTTLSLVALLAITAVSCGKFEEGPSFSLASKKGRITGKWKIEKATSTTAGVVTDITADQGNSTMEFLKDGSGNVSVDFLGAILSIPFTWEFADDDVTLKTTYDDGSGTLYTDEAEVLRLTKKELIYQVIDSLTTERYEFSPAD